MAVMKKQLKTPTGEDVEEKERPRSEKVTIKRGDRKQNENADTGASD